MKVFGRRQYDLTIDTFNGIFILVLNSLFFKRFISLINIDNNHCLTCDNKFFGNIASFRDNFD